MAWKAVNLLTLLAYAPVGARHLADAGQAFDAAVETVAEVYRT